MIHNLVHRLWIIEAQRWRDRSAGSDFLGCAKAGPFLDCRDEDVRDLGGPLHDNGRSSESHVDRRHARLAQEWERHTVDATVIERKRSGQRCLDEFCETAACWGLVAKAAVESGRTAPRLGVERNAEHAIDLCSVRLGCLAGRIGMPERNWDRPCVPECAAERGEPGCEAPPLGDADAPALESRIAMAKALLLPHEGYEFGGALVEVEPLELGDAPVAAQTVGRQPDVALKVQERRGGVVPEDAVNPPAVEAKRAELTLQLRDVISSQHWGHPIQQAITEAVAGLYERFPGQGVADPVLVKTALSLEAADVGLRARSVFAVGITDHVLERDQSKLQVGYLWPAITRAQRQDPWVNRRA